MILETLPALGALTVDEKLRLACELLQDASCDKTLTVETAALLDERLGDHEANPKSVRTTEEVTAGIQKLKARLAAARA